jgi:hypothetical protein
MKVIFGVIVALALVGGAVVYAYGKHVEVIYLTLRADHLEKRIIKLETEGLRDVDGRAVLEEQVAQLEQQTAAGSAVSAECQEARQKALFMPSRFRYGFLDLVGCMTEQDRIDALERKMQDLQSEQMDLNR